MSGVVLGINRKRKPLDRTEVQCAHLLHMALFSFSVQSLDLGALLLLL